MINLRSRKRDTEPLSEEGRAYLAQLIAEYCVLPSSVDNRCARESAEEIQKRFSDPAAKSSLTYEDLFTFQIDLLAIEPIENLRPDTVRLRAMYAQVVGQQRYNLYLQSKPPDPETADESILRADLEFLVSKIRRYQTFAASREKLRSRLSINIGVLTIIVCIIASLVFFCSVQFKWWGDRQAVATGAMIVLFGALGGFVSMQQRLQSASSEGDPIVDVAELKYGQVSVFLSPLSGAIFAMLLYVLFAAKLLQGQLFPAIGIFDPTSKTITDVEKARFSLPNLGQMAPAYMIDWAKLLIWSFIAGFAERFVPDTLDRLIARSQSSDKPAAPAPIAPAAPIPDMPPKGGTPSIKSVTAGPPDANSRVTITVTGDGVVANSHLTVQNLPIDLPLTQDAAHPNQWTAMTDPAPDWLKQPQTLIVKCPNGQQASYSWKP